MKGVFRPRSMLSITPELVEPFTDVLCDRDGVLADEGRPIRLDIEQHVNELIDASSANFKVVTNGTGGLGNINAELVRTWPRVKQYPGVLKNLVEVPSESLLITDSITETVIASRAGFKVFYVTDKFKAHPAEEAFRIVTSPISAPLSKLVQFQSI